MQAATTGSFNLLSQWGAPMKEWLSSPDVRVRDSHRDAGSRYREGGDPGPILMGEAFIVNGHACMYPLDPALPVGELANCRCDIAPYFPEGYEMPQAVLQ